MTLVNPQKEVKHKRLYIHVALTILLCVWFSTTHCQTNYSNILVNTQKQPLLSTYTPTLIASTPAIIAGITPFMSLTAKHINKTLREEMQLWRKNNFQFRRFRFDDYTQFSNFALLYLFRACGIETKHNLLELSSRAATGFVLTSTVALSLKYGINEWRPDHSGTTSFPSGHTTIAFAGAELLRLEYKDTAWPVATLGYAVALTTALMRIYNDKHWLSDVVCGAGLGILTMDLSYLINDLLWPTKTTPHSSTTMLYEL